MPLEADRPRLEDMRSHALEAQSYVDGVALSEFLASPPLQRAVARCLAVIGEAASHVTRETRAELAEIPWEACAGFRGIDSQPLDADKTWAIAREDLPPLASAIEAYLGPVVP